MFRTGLILIALSFLPWLAIPFVPWLPLLNSPTQKASTVTGLIVLAEVLFWFGLLLTGKETWSAIKLHGWKKVPKKIIELIKTSPKK
ncbi:MAG: transporter suffix domain-containing protein [Xanthomonadaceae bacterium]|nr:transporter suffix domain-containing protein [Xanthomonadaceae bacterium]